MEEPGYAGLTVSHLQSLQLVKEFQNKLKPKAVLKIQVCPTKHDGLCGKIK